MLPPAGHTEAERWVALGRVAAAEDLVRRLLATGAFQPVLVLAAEQSDAARLAAAGAQPLEQRPDGFHFGEALAQVIRGHGLAQLAYFGGGSAPLASEQVLRGALDLMRSAAAGTTVVNNLHSTDWALLGAAQAVTDRPQRFPNDNALGWVLSQEAGVPVLDLPAAAATRLDIDTPTDLVAAADHPDLGHALAAFLGQAPPNLLKALHQVRQVLRTPASQLTLIGRTSSHAWAQLERRTQIWVRVFAEERGMLASGRMERGEVRSLLYGLTGDSSPERLVQILSTISQAVLWDTRVWMAAAGGWPSAADRYAADLGWVEQIKDPNLLRVSRAIQESTIPILAGGHGVVAGGIYALLESMEAANCA